MNNTFLSKIALCALGASLSFGAQAAKNLEPATPGGKGGQTQAGQLNKIRALCQPASSKAELDINNVRAMVLNGGDMWWDLSDARYEVPKITDPSLPRKHSIFAGSVWLGGRDDQNTLYVSAQTYRQQNEISYWPGPLDANGTTEAAQCAAFNFHAKINASMIEQFRNYLDATPAANREIADIPKPILEWPAKGNPYLSFIDGSKNLAPFEEPDGEEDGIYDPMTGDLPDIDGDQAIWWVMNDAGGVKEPFTPAIGLELQVMAFAFQTNDLINNMTFYKQTLINKGGKTLNNTYLGQWVDPDLGYFNDDYVGCDVARGLGICYNGDEFDEGANGYGANPPAVGVDFFKGPLADPNDGKDNDRDGEVDEIGEEIIMSNFVYYNNDWTVRGNPELPIHNYNYLQSIWKDNVPLTFGGFGKNDVTTRPYKFMFPGDTDSLGFGFNNPNVPGDIPPFEWTENEPAGNGSTANTPSDRRFLQSAGPFTLTPGKVMDLTIGVVWARANSGGSTGSLGLLKVADDRAQALFDNNFILPAGPDAPIVEISEFDQELIMTIIPREFTTPTGQRQNTETFEVVDSALLNNPAIQDPVYRFEGYKVYQLKDATVTATDLDNEDRARLVAQADIRNGVSDIINMEFDTDVNAFIPVRKVQGSDQGIFHTLRITTDLFATGADRLVNFKRYNYMVIAYAYNSDPENPEQYREGRFANVAFGVPHKVQPEQRGTVLNSSYGSGVGITRIFGTGNGGNVLEISAEEEQNILANNSELELTYLPGRGPINVKVYDPKRVKPGNFRVKFSSVVSYSKSSVSSGWVPQAGDTIVSTGNYTRTDNRSGNAEGDTHYRMSLFPQVPGVGVVRGIVSRTAFDNGGTPDSLITLDVEMVNDMEGGTFVAHVDRRIISGINTTTGDTSYTFDAYITEPRPFTVKHTSHNATAINYQQNDLWTMEVSSANGEVRTVRGEKQISTFNEQLVPDYGIALQFNAVYNPGMRAQSNRLNGFIDATLTHKGAAWLTGVTPAAVAWSNVPTSENIPLKETDPNRILLENVIGGTWTPYTLVNSVSQNGPGYFAKAPASPVYLHKTGNVDVVITPDKSKWTRVVVLQEAASGPRAMTKIGSTKPSIDKEGNPTGENSPYTGRGTIASTGMGWFPGYAIDLDRGIRLNMMFSEKRTLQTEGVGEDLIWQPNSNVDGGRNFIYVMKSQYDRGINLEARFDSLATLPLSVMPAQFQNLFENQVMWVGYPRLATGATLLANDARVKLRVDRQYTSYPSNIPTAENTNPEYTFSTEGVAIATNQEVVGRSALDMIRVVPNPYYAYSEYEQRVLDNIVKVTNLPRRCKISIFTLNGTLIRTINKDNSTTWADWNLKNEDNLPVASGAYIIHVDAGDLGEKVVKWFGILRPQDLESF